MKNADGLLQLRIDLMMTGEIGTKENKILFGGTEIQEPEDIKTRKMWKREGRHVKEDAEGYKIKMWFQRKTEGGNRFYNKWVTYYKYSQTEEI